MISERTWHEMVLTFTMFMYVIGELFQPTCMHRVSVEILQIQ